MAKNKKSSFLSRKAEALRASGIPATPITEQVVVDLDFNQNHARSVAEGKGLTYEKFMADIDKIAEGDDEIVIPGSRPVHTRDLRKNRAVGNEPVEETSEEETVEAENAPPQSKADTDKVKEAKEESASKTDAKNSSEAEDKKEVKSDKK